MLLSFTFENFHSFGGSTEFTMSVGKSKKHPNHIAKIGDNHVLKYAAIYGANAAGKTSLVAAMAASRKLVCGMPISEVDDEYCRSDPSNKDKPTSFEYLFENGGRIFQYGFTAVLSKREFRSEWLYELDQGFTEETLIYSSELKDDGYECDFDYFEEESMQRLQIYVDDIGDRRDSLIIREMMNKRIRDGSDLEVFNIVSEWFRKKLRINSLRRSFSDESVDKAMAHLSRYDTDIRSAGYVPSEVDVFGNMSEEMYRKLKDNPNSFYFGPGIKVVMEGDELKAYKLSLIHDSTGASFDLIEESSGTRQAYDFVGTIFDSGSDDMTFVFDEFGSLMHPLLVKHMVTDFMRDNSDSRNQLIIATHHTSVMSLDIYRRDEIWFVERNGGFSDLYSLEQYEKNVRFDAVLSKGYLEGRFGALPVFRETMDYDGE